MSWRTSMEWIQQSRELDPEGAWSSTENYLDGLLVDPGSLVIVLSFFLST